MKVYLVFLVFSNDKNKKLCEKGEQDHPKSTRSSRMNTTALCHGSDKNEAI